MNIFLIVVRIMKIHQDINMIYLSDRTKKIKKKNMIDDDLV